MSGDPRDVIISPVVSEKSYALLDQGVYTFVVRPDANKIEIRHAVEKLWNVDLVAVRTAVVRGKEKRLGRFIGKRSNWKKAIVTIAAGQNVEFFEGV